MIAENKKISFQGTLIVAKLQLLNSLKIIAASQCFAMHFVDAAILQTKKKYGETIAQTKKMNLESFALVSFVCYWSSVFRNNSEH